MGKVGNPARSTVASTADVDTARQKAEATAAAKLALKQVYDQTNAQRTWTFSSRIKNVLEPGRKERKLAQARRDNIHAAISMHGSGTSLVKSTFRDSNHAPKAWLRSLKAASKPVIDKVLDAAMRAVSAGGLPTLAQDAATGSTSSGHAKTLGEIVSKAWEAVIPPPADGQGHKAQIAAGKKAAGQLDAALVNIMAELVDGVCTSPEFLKLNPLDQVEVRGKLLTYALFQGPGAFVDPALAKAATTKREGMSDTEFQAIKGEFKLRTLLGKSLPALLGVRHESKQAAGDALQFSENEVLRGQAFMTALEERVRASAQVPHPEPQRLSIDGAGLKATAAKAAQVAIDKARALQKGGAPAHLPAGLEPGLKSLSISLKGRGAVDKNHKEPAALEILKCGALDDFVLSLARAAIPDLDLDPTVQWKLDYNSNTGTVEAMYGIPNRAADAPSGAVFAGRILFHQDGEWTIEDPVTHLGAQT